MNPNPFDHEPSLSQWFSLFFEPDLRSKSLILAKIWCMLVAFFATFISGVSPYVLKWNEGFLVLGTQFAGGVFLGTAMMHFLCHADKMFDELTETDYPFAFMLACVGYLITMLADCVISSSVVVKQSIASSVAAGNDANHELQGSDNEKGNSHIGTSQSHCQVHFPNPAFLSASSLGDTILLVVALCFHSVFEGIAIGVAETVGDAWKTLWTVSLHKVFAAIAMGIALLKLIPNRPLLSCAAYAFALAISCPIGVAIGIIIDATAQGVVADWIYAISMSLACGVFIFVSINHLLAKGYKPENTVMVDTPYFKFLAVSLGVGVMAVVMIWDT